MYPVARGQQDLDELSQDQLSILLPARNHELWGQPFDDVLNQLVDSTRRGSALSEGLASHVALQIGLIILANERMTPPYHPRLLAEAACESVRVALSCGRIASALKELWTESEIGLHTNSDYDKVTQGHYGSLFGEFDLRHYVTEASELLEARLSRNQIVRTDFAGRKVLDAGCGSGRYTHALASYGASEAIGVDFSPINISNANRLNSNYIKNSLVRFELADVRRLPFADQSFDIVFSNGVVHHLPEPREGVRELLRVLKPGGWGFF